jgi:hypothetical protein
VANWRGARAWVSRWQAWRRMSAAPCADAGQNCFLVALSLALGLFVSLS